MTQVPETRQVTVGAAAAGGATIGGRAFTVIAGPCAIESAEQFSAVADHARGAGAAILRGGIYKLRTRPDAFQGLGEAGLAVAAEVRERSGLPLVSEVVDPRQIEAMLAVVDMFQVGTRNMYNYELLKELGRAGKPVLLKRAFSARVEEWLLAAEYVIQAGNPDVVLCERGIRTFETAMRNTLDIASVAHVKATSRLPVIVDPSHATGRRELIAPMALAAAAAGADGLLVEVHADPDRALSDARQTLDFAAFTDLMQRLERVLGAVDRTLASSS